MQRKLVPTNETRIRTMKRNKQVLEIYERKYLVVKIYNGHKLPFTEDDFVWKQFDMTEPRPSYSRYKLSVNNYEKIKKCKLLYRI